MTTVGRNDPCPCGSGQKYKKCCLPRDDAARAAERPRQTARETVMPKLLRFADMPQFDDDHVIADTLFWGDRLDGLSEEEELALVRSEDAQAKYNTWFVWDLDIDDGITVADLFLEQKGRTLDAAERAYVERMRRSHLSLYQLERVDHGRGLDLRDLWTRERIFVHERLGSEQIVQWDILGARLVTHEDGLPVFEGGVYLFPVSDKATVLRTLKRYHRKYLKTFPNEDRAAFFKRHGMIFNHLWLDLVVLRPLPRLATAEGDEMMFARSVFDIVDEHALRAALASRDDIDAADDGSYVWQEDAEEFRRTLGTFRIDGRRCVLETTSRERDARGRAWLADLAPGAATYRATELETVAQALARHREKPAAPSSDEVPPDVADEITRKMQDQHYRKWLDEPVPALRGATPREAAASRKLRPLLVELQREFQNRYQRALQRGERPYDTSWLWTELGLR